MNIKEIFNVFSNRKEDSKVIKYSISIETRNRVLIIMDRKIKEIKNGYSFNHESNVFQKSLVNVREMFQLKLGRMNLANNADALEDILIFLSKCENETFLDFIEYIFRSNEFNISEVTKNEMISDINFIFEQDEIPFRLTKYIEEWVDTVNGDVVSLDALPFGNPLRKNIISYPQIINKDDDFTFSEIVTPVLELLKDSRFNNANKEFLEALEHYKNNRYKECITSCCSSLESTIKVICKIKKWEFSPNSTCNPLVLLIIEKSQLPKWYDSILTGPASFRNKLGSSHGKGDQNVTATKNQARYQINITAAEIIFLIEEIV